MFNNVVLDVFIGLVLVYLLYSLFVTIVSEIVVSWLGLRSRILRVSVEKMLNDGYFANSGDPKYRGFWFIFQRFFLKEFEDFKYSTAGKFYLYPSIKYLASRSGEQKTFFTETKPSYISAENFADTLIQMLKDRGAGDTDLEKIKFTLAYNTQNIQPGTLKRIRDLSENAGIDLDAFKKNLKAWYNETQDRASGWYKRKMQLILFWLGFVVAVIFNVDSLRIARILSKDEKARNQLVAMGIELSKDSARYKEFTSGNDSSLSKAILDSGYRRVTRDLEDANMVLGLSWGTDKLLKTKTTKVTTKGNNAAYIMITGKMSDFERLQNNLRTSNDALVTNSDYINLALDTLSMLGVDSLLTDSTGPYRLKADTIQERLQFFRAQLRRDSLIIRQSGQLVLRFVDTINKALKNNYAVVDSIRPLNATTIEISGRRHYYWNEKLAYVLGGTFRDYRFVGFFITGLMLSLGAPFWFDLLKKLISIRSDGVKPEEKKNPGNTDIFFDNKGMGPGNGQAVGVQKINTGAGTANRENAEMALKSLTQKIKRETGIVAIALENNAANQPVLSVISESAAIDAFLQNKYGTSETIANGYNIAIQYSVDNEIVIHAAMAGSEIRNDANAANVMGRGTLGCHMLKRGSNAVYFISCWHVMKDNIHWHVAPLNPLIVDVANRKQLGRIEGGFLSHDVAIGIDLGIARYDDINDAIANAQFAITSQHRAVTAFDSLVQTPVKVFGKNCRLKDAVIFHDKINARIKYPDGSTHLLNDVFSIVNIDPATGRKTSPTSPGDSGAVVTDANGVPLGMVVGGNGTFSYAMKFSNAFDPEKPFSEFSFKI